MKLNKILAIIAIATMPAITFVGCKNEDPAETDFDNKVYINSAAKVASMLIKPTISEYTQTIISSVAKPATQSIELVYKADLSKVDTYNQAYYDHALPLPAENYELLESRATIAVGTVKSTAVTVHFKDINLLNRDEVYVLPITLASASNIKMLESARTNYFIFKGAALINVVGDIAKNYLTVNWSNDSDFRDMKTLTVESLIRVRDFGAIAGKGEAMSTLLGIEGHFLIRMGDSGYPKNQVQLVSPAGKFPEANTAWGLPTNKWVHIAVVYDVESGSRIIYVDGKVQAQDANASGTVDLASDEFFIGRAYNDERWLEGEISEVRIWNVVRTAEQIAANPYVVDPTSQGLIAYWKFDEGTGSVVKDYTANGNDATANSGIKWMPVSLPVNKK